MPKRKERMAGYIRESDPSLADSVTIESQAKAVRKYAEKEGYIYDVAVHEFREAISAYTIPYMQRPQLLKLLEAAKRREFDVVVVSEVRAISRRQVEVFIIYDILQKYGVRIETIKEKFEDDAMGRAILGLRAAFAEIEREQSYQRMQRGKKDRIEIGKAPNGHPKPCYGFVFKDSETETNARYEFNRTIIYVDEDGEEWSEYKVSMFIIGLVKQAESLKGIADALNSIGVPPPKKPLKGLAHWQAPTIHKLITNPQIAGRVYANKYMRMKGKVYTRPMNEWVLLPEGTAPAMISWDEFQAIQKQLAANKQDSLRNNKHTKDLGILRAGYVFCGICGRRMYVVHHNTNGKVRNPEYQCVQKSHKNDLRSQHYTCITLTSLDREAWEKAVEIIRNPASVRAKVAMLREENKPVVVASDIQNTIEKIRQKMKNLYTLAENAPDDEELARITQRMQELGKQKREAEALLYDLEEDEEERAAVEEEIVKFEKWVEKVRPFLADPTYTSTYEEQRLAVRIIGIKATVFPANGDHPFRAKIDATIPDIVAKIKYCVINDPW